MYVKYFHICANWPRLFSLFLILSIHISCTQKPTPPEIEPLADYSIQFEKIWYDFDLNYSYFNLKNIDWAETKTGYEPLVESPISYSNFISDVILKMLATLRDEHVYLITNSNDTLKSFTKDFSVNYQYNRSFDNYFNAEFQFSTPNEIIAFAFLTDEIGYIRINSWQNKFTEEILTFHSILAQFRDSKALIIDVRPNFGGLETLAAEIAGRFTDSGKIYAYHQFRIGPKHTDFTAITPRSFVPTGTWQFTKPVAVLIGRKCASTNEHFISMMSTLDQVFTVGDTTRGSTGRPIFFHLDNGITYSISNWISFKSDKTILQDSGIFPDFVIPSNESIVGNRDLVLEKAIHELKRKLATDFK